MEKIKNAWQPKEKKVFLAIDRKDSSYGTAKENGIQVAENKKQNECNIYS